MFTIIFTLTYHSITIHIILIRYLSFTMPKESRVMAITSEPVYVCVYIYIYREREREIERERERESIRASPDQHRDATGRRS